MLGPQTDKPACYAATGLLQVAALAERRQIRIDEISVLARAIHLAPSKITRNYQ
jgi:hypothetical protein